MEGLKPPRQLSFEGNISENWKKFKQMFEIYMVASGNEKKSPEVKVAIFLNVVGEEALEKYNTFDLTDDQKKDLKIILDTFEAYCLPKVNESVDRHVFFNRVQQSGESFHEFLTSVKKLSSTCGFGELKESLLRDRIISGILDKQLKDRLLREGDLTLEKCIKMCKASELAEVQLKTLDAEQKIEAVTKNKYGSKKSYQHDKNHQSDARFKEKKPDYQDKIKQNKENYKQKNTDYENRNRKPCSKCGKFHQKFNCPAFNKTCLKCHKRNHYARMCNAQKSINYVRELDENFRKCSVNNNLKDEYILGVVNKSSSKNNCDWYEKLKINIFKYLYAKIDTGAQCNVLPYAKYKQMNLRENILENSDICLNNYNGSKIDVKGKCKLRCETSKGIKATVEFQVVESANDVPAVLGLPTLIELNLVQRINTVEYDKKSKPELLSNYPDLFTGLGNMDCDSYHIKLKANAVGKIDPCRKVPLRLMEPLKQELLRMEKSGVIRKIDEPTEFVSSLVLVQKNDGSLRICLDPQYLNENILREHYYLPTFAEIAAKMSGAKVFSTLDANQAFWQLKISEESSKYTTFNTPFGRYCFLRLPYGICSAPEIFHKSFSEIFSDLEGVSVYIDDLIIWGKDKTEHDLRLRKVLDKAREKNVKFNLKKCKIGLSEVRYLGHKFSKDGLQPDEEKIKAIVEMKTPKDAKELERFLGIITYVSKFIPHVSQLTATLRDLVKKHNVWNWDATHEKSFQELKNILVKQPVLQYFDPKSPVTLSVDASQDGLGAVIIQNNLPIAYASKALTETQKNYAQIEKETLAIVFGCEKFHQYIFGKHFIIENDHKPLESIFKKTLDKCPARLQRMRLRLQPYSFDMIYKPGKELLIADALSRSFLEDSKDFFDGEIESHIDMIIQSIPMSTEKLRVFQTETEKDDEMQVLKKLIQEGWPMEKSQVPDLGKPYFHFKEELSTANGLILKNSRVIVPRSLRKDMLKRIHYSHLGVEKCKNKAREILYWPGMTKEIEDLILNCFACLSFQKSNAKEPLMPKEIPNGPWEVIGTDLFHFQGNDFLMVIDYFSKYVEIAMLRELTSLATIKLLKTFFARFGIPSIVYSDNGPQYDSMRYRNFAKTWNFESRTSSPRFAQSNGMVERHLQTAKNMLLKADFEGSDPYLALLEYRNTPIASDLPSPSELMFGRKIKGIMPIKEDFFPEEKYKDIREKLIKRQEIQKKYFDRNVKPLKPVEDGEIVMIDFNNKGVKQPAKVLGKAERPRSFRLLKEDGHIIERNRKDILRGSQKINFKVERGDVPGVSSCDESMPGGVSDDADKTVNKSKTVPHYVSPDKAIQPVNPVQHTRFGRTVKKPSYLKDYDT